MTTTVSRRTLRGAAPGKGAKPHKTRHLSAILCPLMPREMPLALANFDVWEQRFPPVQREVLAPEDRPKLVFSFSSAPDPALEGPLREAFDAHPIVRQSFAGLEVLFLDLPPEKDLYVRNPSGPVPPYGFKAGPNWMFYETMRRLRPEGGFVFLMETDCQPLVPNWLPRLEGLAARNSDAWVVGSPYCGASPLHWSIARHINGNALYHVGDAEYWEFLDGFFWDWMHDYIRSVDPNLAYDCAWEAFLNRAEMENVAHPHWMLSRGVFHRFRLTPGIVNIGGLAEQAGHYIWTRAQLLNRFPGAIIAHGPVAADHDHRRGQISLGRARPVPGVEIGGGWVEFAGTGQEVAWERSVWIAARSFEPGDVVTLRFAVGEASGMTVEASIRDTNGRLLDRRSLPPPEPGITIRRAKPQHAVEGHPPFLRLELRGTGPEGSRARILEPMVTITRGEEMIARNVDILG